jgi:drug/metabolite transporter (DMT)-like permease
MTKDLDHPYMSHPKIAALLAALCGVLWGSAYPGIKLGYELFQVPSGNLASQFLFAGMRFILAGIFVAITFGIIHGNRSKEKKLLHHYKIQKSHIGPLILLGLTQTGLHYGIFYQGLAFTQGSTGAIVNSTGVFFSAILAHFIYTYDKLSKKGILGILLGFVGVILVNLSPNFTFSFTLQGEGLVILAAFTQAAATIYGRRITKTIDPIIVTSFQLLVGGSSLLLLGRIMGAQWFQGPPQAWLILGYLGFLSAAAFSLWTSLLKHNKVSSITIYNFVIPISGTLLSALFLGESVLELRFILALPAVAGGIYLVNSARNPVG